MTFAPSLHLCNCPLSLLLHLFTFASTLHNFSTTQHHLCTSSPLHQLFTCSAPHAPLHPAPLQHLCNSASVYLLSSLHICMSSLNIFTFAHAHVHLHDHLHNAQSLVLLNLSAFSPSAPQHLCTLSATCLHNCNCNCTTAQLHNCTTAQLQLQLQCTISEPLHL